MTNQEAIDLLDNLIGMIEDNHGSDYDSAIRMAIDALESKWIPVSERLPKQQQTVLIQDFGEITIGYLNAENRWRDLTNLDDYLKGVDAWMPLPECYRGDSDG